ncbi:hypothetical protein [Stratiformator vulcanicus]|uniref:Uncharacterized protein n=1 Tax=Stratiformator vulcanicus TaxID=2527980 RepID=A0A517QZV7_9PLAN|nr:hypothetical protein [Stratiformator vulcanicus]QDT37186.1 hypothetical protein Pan189_15580 [Stratiformator vulcanicus]
MSLSSRLIASFKHAFAVDAGPVEPTARQAEVIDKLCREIVRRGMVAPALMTLETSRPLNFVSSQAIHFFDPLVSAISDATAHRELAEFLEQRGSVEYIGGRLEETAGEAESERTSIGDSESGKRKVESRE